MGHLKIVRVPPPAAVAQTPITPNSTAGITLAVAGVDNHTLTASLKLSPNSGNTASLAANGLYVPPETVLTVSNSSSVALAASGTANHTLQASLRVDATAGRQNLLTVSAAGVRVAAAIATRVVTATGNVTPTDTAIIVNNAAANVTLTVTGAFDPGHVLTVTRAAGSTGTITITGAGFTFQALAGTVGATTTIPAHSAAGAGVANKFTLNGTTWYRVG